MTIELNKLSLMFFLPQLGGGGAEMNAVRLASSLVSEGITPTYVVARGPGEYARYLPASIEVLVLDTGNINSSTVRLVRSRKLLASIIDERCPDILCPVMVSSALSSLFALPLTKHKPAIVLSIQNSLSVSHEKYRSLRNSIELHLIRKLFPKLDGVIALSEGVAAELQRIVPELIDKVVVVPNVGLPLSAQASQTLNCDKSENVRGTSILACGRLTEQKDYPTLFRAFSLLDGFSIYLTILGDGRLRKNLMQLANELGIAERVIFKGFQSDPITFMRQSDIFVLSSRWEGFGNVLVEAMSVGTPVVSTDCPHGPGEIIENGRTGILVPVEQPDALAAALQELIDNPALRHVLGEAGQLRAQDYSGEKIGRAYARQLRDIYSKSLECGVNV